MHYNGIFTMANAAWDGAKKEGKVANMYLRKKALGSSSMFVSDIQLGLHSPSCRDVQDCPYN
jgi:hypothetical protein